MKPDTDRLIEVFHQAKTFPAGAAREQFLTTSCGDNTHLRARVASLLRSEESAGDFLMSALLDSHLPVLIEKPGDRIGRYQLLEKIGEGGCGVVYMAEQEKPVRRRVALKVIKLGMDTRQVVARFEAERQALAMMDHPHIAKVLDGGATEAGRPYFVMELVRGIKITEYCDQNQLSTRQRLELFIQVCQAIQHAHQKGIIHRDLKPSNILVTQEDGIGVPKIIDFGIAKATTGQLTDLTLFTGFSQFIGTPSYMSPEQAQMSALDVDTRADIYSLGILLYELLTGNPPFDAKELAAAGLDEMRRKIREDEPARPSACLSTMDALTLTAVAKRRDVASPKLIHLLSGDLDWLVMKCLEKDRARRYQTANALAADLQRHLNDEPVLARPPTRAYRLRKLVRRNRLAFAAGAAITAALIAGLGLSTWLFLRERVALQAADENAAHAQQQASRAERLRLEAEANAAQAQQARADEVKMRTLAEAEAAKSQQVSTFLQDMLKSVGPSKAMGRDTTMLREILDQTASRLNDLKAQPAVEADLRSTLGDTYSDLGQFGNAAAMHEKALALRRTLLGTEHPDVAASLHRLAGVRWRQGRLQEAEAMYRDTLAMRRKLLGHDHLDLAQTLIDFSFLLGDEKKWAEAESAVRECLSIFRTVHGEEHPSVAYALHLLAWNAYVQGNLAEAEALSRKELAMRRKLQGNEHPDGLSARFDLAVFLHDQGKSTEAEAVVSEIMAMRERVLVLDKEKPDIAQFIHQLGSVLQRLGKNQEAEGVYREELTLRRKVLGNSHPKVAKTLHSLASLLHGQGKLLDAETDLREALVIRRKAFGDDHPEVFESLDLLSMLLREQNKLEEAESTAREVVAGKRKLLGNEHSDVAKSLHLLAWNLNLRGKSAEAEALSREEIAIWRKLLGDDDPKVAWALGDLTVFLRAQGKLAEAEAAIRESLQIREKRFGNEHPDVISSRKLLADLLRQQGKPDEISPAEPQSNLQKPE